MPASWSKKKPARHWSCHTSRSSSSPSLAVQVDCFHCATELLICTCATRQQGGLRSCYSLPAMNMGEGPGPTEHYNARVVLCVMEKYWEELLQLDLDLQYPLSSTKISADICLRSFLKFRICTRIRCQSGASRWGGSIGVTNVHMSQTKVAILKATKTAFMRRSRGSFVKNAALLFLGEKVILYTNKVYMTK